MNRRSRELHFEPAETKKASQLVFEQLRSHILSGLIKPGDELPAERNLMRQFRRSHPTIREALRMLEAAELIDVIPGNAAVVRPPQANPVAKPLDELLRYQEVTVGELLEFMAAIFPDIANLAVLRRDDRDMANLVVEYNRIKAMDSIHFLAVLPLYDVLTACCKNPLIAVVWQALGKMIILANQDIETQDLHVNQEIVENHRLLIDAVLVQNGNKAQAQAQECWHLWTEQENKLKMSDPEEQSPEPNTSHQLFQPVRTEKASEAVYRQIREKIMTGELLPGDKLPPERKLMELFNRSRPTIREALRMLESSHYVRTTPGSGTVINTMTTQAAERSLHDLLEMKRVERTDLKELRNICETVVAAWAARRRSNEDLQKLRNILNDVDNFVEQIEESMAMGHRFNLFLAQAAHNKTAYALTRAVSEVNYSLVRQSWEEQRTHILMKEMIHHSRTIWQQHRRIFTAIEAQDPERARSETEAHIEAANHPID